MIIIKNNFRKIYIYQMKNLIIYCFILIIMVKTLHDKK